LLTYKTDVFKQILYRFHFHVVDRFFSRLLDFSHDVGFQIE
jgi:hypothetical protein